MSYRLEQPQIEPVPISRRYKRMENGRDNELRRCQKDIQRV